MPRIRVGPNIFLSGANFFISSPAGLQVTPALASDGSRSLAVWTDNRGGAFQAFGSLVDSAAGVTPNFPISNNGAYLVTWLNEKAAGSNTVNINGARVTTAGGVTDRNGFLVASDTHFFNRPALARGVDGEWGVAYSFVGSGDQAVWLRRIANTK